jgi:hypothetical protein
MPNSPTSPDSYGELRELSHERIYLLWQAAKVGGPLEGDDAQLVQAMRDHPEYYEVWDHANEFLQEQVAINGANPFLHVVMHTVVENQAAQGNPPEVPAVLEFKVSHRLPRHQVVHEIANEFAQLLWQALHNREPFDNEAYRRKLDRLLPRSRRTRR